MRRSFKLTSVDEEYDNVHEGRYMGRTPMQAASKAFTYLKRYNNYNSNESHDFTIRETTRGSRCRTYTYDGKYVTYDYNTSVQMGRDKVIRFSGYNQIKKKTLV